MDDADAADLIDAEIDYVDVSDVEDRSNEQRGYDPDDDEGDDGASLSRVQLLTAPCWRFHREIMIDAQRCQREYTARYCQTCVSKTAVNQLLNVHRFCRAMRCKRGPSRHTVSVCLSVRPSRSYILSKRIKISIKKFHRRITNPF